MSQDWYADVLEFTRRLAPNRIGSLPACPGRESRDLVRRLIKEEWHEADEAMQKGDLPGVADGLADLIYVSLHAAITYGIDLRPVWDAVQAANMAKEGGPTREDGKILKPEGWQPPDVAGILARQHGLNFGRQEYGFRLNIGRNATLYLDIHPGHLTAHLPDVDEPFGNWRSSVSPTSLSPTIAQIEEEVSATVGYRVRVQGVWHGEIYLERVREPAPVPPLSVDDLNPEPFGDEVRAITPTVTSESRKAQLIGRACRSAEAPAICGTVAAIDDETA